MEDGDTQGFVHSHSLSLSLFGSCCDLPATSYFVKIAGCREKWIHAIFDVNNFYDFQAMDINNNLMIYNFSLLNKYYYYFYYLV